jgi:hypothetical protein
LKISACERIDAGLATFQATTAGSLLESNIQFSGRSSISPVAILATMMAAPITSAGRFSPLGPLGMPIVLRQHLTDGARVPPPAPTQREPGKPLEGKKDDGQPDQADNRGPCQVQAKVNHRGMIDLDAECCQVAINSN